MKTPQKETPPQKTTPWEAWRQRRRIQSYLQMMAEGARTVSIIDIELFLVYLCGQLVIRSGESFPCAEKFISGGERKFRPVSR